MDVMNIVISAFDAIHTYTYIYIHDTYYSRNNDTVNLGHIV